jgi:uncharacterized protein YjgD (DUF1641 family)
MRRLKTMLNVFKRQANKEVKDFISVPEKQEVAGIIIPVIPLEKYSRIAKQAAGLMEKLGTRLSEQTGKPVEEIMENFEVIDLIRYIPLIVEVAAEEFFSFTAYILDSETSVIRKLGLVDLMRILEKVNQVNDFAEVKRIIENFMAALGTKGTDKTGQGKR